MCVCGCSITLSSAVVQRGVQQQLSQLRAPSRSRQSFALSTSTFWRKKPPDAFSALLLERKRKTFNLFLFFKKKTPQPHKGMPSINMKLEMVTIIACEVDTEVFTSDKMQVRLCPRWFVPLCCAADVPTY